jgi:hypothetical protein
VRWLRLSPLCRWAAKLKLLSRQWMSVQIDASAVRPLTFFTGDLPGTYIAEIVGITSAGKRIVCTMEFRVELKKL